MVKLYDGLNDLVTRYGMSEYQMTTDMFRLL